MQNLLTEPKFFPYFLTQMLGAFNDNLYKNVLLILVAFAPSQSVGMDAHLYINLAAGVFILPFFLFSPFAGELADRYEKSFFIRRTKIAELIIMIIAALAFVYKSYLLLLFLLFLMGTQSAFFGPIKYALLPQVIPSDKLLNANAWVEASTFLAILSGTMLAGVIAGTDNATLIAAIAVVFFASLGLLSAHFIPSIDASNPELIVRLAWKSQFKHTLVTIRENRIVWLFILAVSWFWFLGASYLTQFPKYTQEYLGGSQEVVSMLLVLFSVGIAIGAFICARLPKINCSKIGIAGLSIFGFLLYFLTPSAAGQHQALNEFIKDTSLWGVFISLVSIGICGGLYVVPLFTQIQRRAKPSKRAQTIAGSNIFDALFMVCSAVFSIFILVVLSLTIAQYFLILALLNTAVASLIFHQAAFSLTTEQVEHEKA